MKRGLRASSVRMHSRTGVENRRRFAGLLALGALFLVGTPVHAAQQYSQNLPFQTTNQSMWETGSQFVLNYSRRWGTSWNSTSAGGPGFRGVTIPGFCIPAVVLCDPITGLGCVEITPEKCFDAQDLGTFGSEASASTSGEIALRPNLSVQGGAVNVDYPILVTIGYPDNGTLRPGDTFSVTTSFLPTQGTRLTTSSPGARLTLDAILGANFRSSATVKAGALGTISGTLFDLTIPHSDTQIFNSDSQIARGALNAGVSLLLSGLTRGVLSGHFNELAINTQGGLLLGTQSLASEGQANFFNAKVDYTCAFTAGVGIPCPSQRFSLDLGSTGNFSANAQFMDLYHELDFNLYQQFRFNATPKVRLLLSTGQTVDMNVGETRTLTFPTVSGNAPTNNLTVTPTFNLDNTLTNLTQLRIDPTLSFTALNLSYSGSAGGQSLGSFSLEPFATQSVSFPSPVTPETLFQDSFPLQGFSPVTTAPFTVVGYTYPRPSLSIVSPPAIKQGSGAVTLNLQGAALVDPYTNAAGTIPGSTVHWNGQSRITRKTTPSRLDADLLAADTSVEGTFDVTIVNPAPGGGTSDPMQVIVDGTPPVTTAALSGPQNANHNNWYTGPVGVVLSATDNLSGVLQNIYSVDGGGTVHRAPPSITRGPFAFPSFTVAGDGVHTVSYWSGDRVDNRETEKSTPVKIDGTPPTIIGSRDPSAGNEHGWNNQPVTVHFTCSDATSGVAQCPADTVLSSDGANQLVSGTAMDNAGHSASATVAGINIDLTKPTITYTGNAGRYTVDQMVNITCTVNDNLSGVLSHTGQDIVGPAYSFALGNNSRSAEATDKAGNVGQGSTSFIVEVTYGSLCALVEQLVSDDGIANSLCMKLRAAEAAAARGQQDTKANILEAFVREVEAQTGQHISTGAAPILIRMARAL
jgi:hypothetical protein